MAKRDEVRCPHCTEPMWGAACVACGKAQDDVYDLQYAKPGSMLGGRYLIGSYVRKNGEGAVYVGFDNATQQKVWVREYFPQAMASRDLDTGRISPLSGCGAQYKALMSDFVDIGNDIKRLGVTEQVVPLESVISENNTVYAIYKGMELTPFEQFLEVQGGRLSFRHAFALLLPIFNALEVLHSQGQIHRGVSPETLYIGPDGKLYLWDFALGATRTSGSEIDAELFSGYSAPEQYSPNGWQGSWTDVYALAAVLYRAVSGVVPPRSNRIDKEQNQLAPLEELLPDISRHVSVTVREAMIPAAEERLQTVQTLVSRLVEQRPSDTSVYDLNKVQRGSGDGRGRPSPRHAGRASGHNERKRREPRERGGIYTFKYVVLGTLITMAGLLGVFYYVLMPMLTDIIGGGQSAMASTEPAPAPQPQQPVEAEQPQTIPNFVGTRFADIENSPEYRDRFAFSPRFERRPEWGGGVIFEQSPPPGAPMVAQGIIHMTFWISLEDVPMPDVVGFTLEQATDILYNIDIIDFQIMDMQSTEPGGTVLQSVPEAGAMLNPVRDFVALFVSTAPDPDEDFWGDEDWRGMTPQEFHERFFDPETGQYHIPPGIP